MTATCLMLYSHQVGVTGDNFIPQSLNSVPIELIYCTVYYTKDGIYSLSSHPDLQNLYNMFGSPVLIYLIPLQRI